MGGKREMESKEKGGGGTGGNPSVRRGRSVIPWESGAFCLIREGLSGLEKGVGGFGKDGVAFRDKGAANFRGRGERAEAEEL